MKEPGRLSDLVGYEITSIASDAETARKKVDFLVNYVADASLNIQIENYISDTLAAKRLLLTSALFGRDTEAYNLSLLENRLVDLRRLSVNYSASVDAADRQILSIEKNSERYMPLPMQMIAVERERFDINERLARTQRQVDGLPFEEAMLVAHEKIAREINGGKALALALIQDTQARILEARQGYEMNASLGYKDRYSRMLTTTFTPSRFIVSPTLPVMPVRSPLKSTLVFAVLGGVLALLWQFKTAIMRLIIEVRGKDDPVNTTESLSEVKKLHRA